MAQQEREFISQRTKQGMAKSTKQAGNPHLALKTEYGLALIEKNHQLIKKNRKARADKATANVKAFAAIKYMKGTLREKVDYLNRNGFVTSTNKMWHPTSVSRLIDRYEETVDIA
jgi:DNA invertase Pin-like site-specific DNA recombinase